MTFFKKPKIEQSSNVSTLIRMLKTKRPAYSANVTSFIECYIDPICKKHKGYFDDAGNYIVKIGKNPNVMFSCHTDTVHYTGGIQKLKIRNNILTLHDNESSNCLGGDDTVGCYLMLEMIKANVSGLYIFHANEEIGCIGSKYIAKNNVSLLNNIVFAIAFDRKGTNSIITHQMNQRCCSNEFSDSLAMLLPDGYISDPHGSYTDTYSYMYQISECTNVSCGYYNQHSNKESVDLTHVMLLRDHLIRFDSSKLVKKRNPSDFDDDYEVWGYDRYESYGGKSYYSSPNDNSYRALFNFVQNNPDIITDFLNDGGYDLEYFETYFK
jgi:hypothetical protein